MVGIVFSSSFHWYYIHGSRMYIFKIVRNSRTQYVASTIQGGIILKVVFLNVTKKTILVL